MKEQLTKITLLWKFGRVFLEKYKNHRQGASYLCPCHMDRHALELGDLLSQ